MAKVTIFCQECGEPNTDNAKNCTHCGIALEGPSREFIEEVSFSEPRKFDPKILIPGIKVGAVAGVISGLIWGINKLFLFSAMTPTRGVNIGGMAIGGILLLGLYLVFNVICGIITGSVLAFFSVLHDTNGCRIYAILVNIIIAMIITFPVMFLFSLGIHSTLPLFYGFVTCLISGTIGGAVFSTTIPIIYQQYFTNK